VTESFENILEDNKDKIYRICRIYAVDPIEPQDLFQEVVFQVWKSYAGFEGKSSTSTWVYKIALNVCMRSKMKLDKKNDKTEQLGSIHIMADYHGHNEVQEEKYQALRTCINLLNESDQSLVIMLLEELPYKEMAQVTGLTENHVAVKMKRIRKVLFECISPKLS